MVNIDVDVDYYAALGLTSDASDADIKKAYRKLALKYHPDRNPGKESEVIPEFQRIGAANEVLTTPSLKASYDARRRRPTGTHATRTDARREARASAGAAPSWTASAQFAQSFERDFPKTRAAHGYGPFPHPPGSTWGGDFERDRARAFEAHRVFQNMHARPHAGWGGAPRPAPTARQQPASGSSSTGQPRAQSAYEKYFNDPKKDPRRKARMKHGFSPDDPEGDEPMAAHNSSYTRSSKAREQFAHLFATVDDDETETPPADTETSPEEKSNLSSKEKSSSEKHAQASNPAPSAAEANSSSDSQSHGTSTTTTQEEPLRKEPAAPKPGGKDDANASAPATEKPANPDTKPVYANIQRRPIAVPRSRRSRVNMAQATSRSTSQPRRPPPQTPADAKPDVSGGVRTDGHADRQFVREAHGASAKTAAMGPPPVQHSRNSSRDAQKPDGATRKAQAYVESEWSSNPAAYDFNQSDAAESSHFKASPPRATPHKEEARPARNIWPEMRSFWPGASTSSHSEGILLDLDDDSQGAAAASPPKAASPPRTGRYFAFHTNETFPSNSKPHTTPAAEQPSFSTPKYSAVDINFVPSGESASFSAAFVPLEKATKPAPAAHPATTGSQDDSRTTVPSDPPAAQPDIPSTSAPGGATTPSPTEKKSPLETFSSDDWANALNANPGVVKPERTTRSPGDARRSTSSSRVRCSQPGSRTRTSPAKPTEAPPPPRPAQSQPVESARRPPPPTVEPDAMDVDDSHGPPQQDAKASVPAETPSNVRSESVANGGPNVGPRVQPMPNMHDLRQNAPFTPTNNGSVNNLDDIGASLPFESKAEAPDWQSQTNGHGKTVLPRPPKAPKVPLKLFDHGRRGASALGANLWRPYVTQMAAYFQEWKKFNAAMLIHFNQRQKLMETGLSPNWLTAIGDGFKVKIGDDEEEEEEEYVASDRKASFGDYMVWLAEDEKIREHWSVAQERHMEAMHQFSKARKAMQRSLSQQHSDLAQHFPL